MKTAKKILSLVLVMLMLFSMSMVATSAYTSNGAFEIATAPKDTAKEDINGDVYGIIGDADMSEAVNVRDATLIQKFAADIEPLSEVQKVLADVNFDEKVNVRDATAIQKWVASIEISDPVGQYIYAPAEDPTEVPSSTAPTTVPTTAVPSTAPATEVPTQAPSSVDEPTQGPTEVPTELPTEVTTQVPTQAPSSADEPTQVPTTAAPTTEAPTDAPVETEITVYFTNNEYWSEVYAYYWGGDANVTWPGEKMTFAKVNKYGQDIYSAVIPANVEGLLFGAGEGQPQTVDIKENIADGKGFYCVEEVEGKWTVDVYDYIDDEPAETTAASTTAPATTVAPTAAPTTAAPTTAAPTTAAPTTAAPTTAAPTTAAPTTAAPTTAAPTTAAPTTAVPTTVAPVEPTTIKVYFSNNEGWENVYIYGFYGVAGETAEAIWPDEYPGAKMTFVEVNKYGQDIFCYDVPADIDYIKFSDGSADNNRTDNIPNAEFEDGTGFYLTEKGSKYWSYATYEYVATTPVDPTTTAAATTTATTAAPTAAPTTAAPTTAAPTDPPVMPEYTVYFVNSGKWSKVNAYVWSPEAATWPGIAMVKTSEKAPNGAEVYSLTLPDTYANIIFNDGSSQTPDLTYEEGKYYDYATGKWYANLDDIPAEGPAGYTVYCVNSKKWSKINAYVWEPNGAGWPGTAMTNTGEKAANGSDIYSITFAQNHGKIIFNNGSSQTDNLTFHAGQYFDLATNKWYASAAEVK